MKKLIPLLIFMTCSIVCLGQKYKEGPLVQVIVHKIIIPDGGSLKEALDLTYEWTENVLRKNENIEKVQLLLSDTEKDTIDLMVLYNFKMNNTRDTNEINLELIKSYWPEEGAFDNFIKNLHRYINPKLNERSLFKELVLKKK